MRETFLKFPRTARRVEESNRADGAPFDRFPRSERHRIAQEFEERCDSRPISRPVSLRFSTVKPAGWFSPGTLSTTTTSAATIVEAGVSPCRWLSEEKLGRFRSRFEGARFLERNRTDSSSWRQRIERGGKWMENESMSACMGVKYA